MLVATETAPRDRECRSRKFASGGAMPSRLTNTSGPNAATCHRPQAASRPAENARRLPFPARATGGRRACRSIRDTCIAASVGLPHPCATGPARWRHTLWKPRSVSPSRTTTTDSLPICAVTNEPGSTSCSRRAANCQVCANTRSRSSSRYTGSLYSRAGMVDARRMSGSNGKTRGIERDSGQRERDQLGAVRRTGGDDDVLLAALRPVGHRHSVAILAEVRRPERLAVARIDGVQRRPAAGGEQ